MKQLRVLNDEGISKFKEFIAAARLDSALPAPVELLDDGMYSDRYATPLDIGEFPSGSGYDLGRYLNVTLSRIRPNTLSRDHVFWTSLALLFFDSITGNTAGGKRKILEDASYVLDRRFSFQKYYRHLVRTPWLAVNRHSDNSKVLLIAVGDGVRTEIGEQLGAYPDIFGCHCVIEGAYQMYFDAAAQRPKRGVSGKMAGTPRRLAAIVRQLQLTYDLMDCKAEEFLALLPKEFDRWK